MDKILESFWKSVISLADKLADNTDVILLAALKIILTVIVAKIVIWISKGVIRRLIERRKKREPDSVLAKKAETVATLLQSVIRYTVYFLMTATILGQLGLGITAGSILATAGVGGVALGLGAQSLIKDVLSGFFMLFENQFAVGDFVELRDMKGTVEAITLRTTLLRVFTGELVTIPNGTIDKVINYTRGNILVVLSVYIAYGQDTQKAVECVKSCAKEYMAQHSEVTEAPEVVGVADVGEGGVEIRAFVKVQPMTQWKVERELKASVYEAFRAQGIEAPFPKRIVINRQ